MSKSFKNKVIYQIYLKSFKDTNGDGIGDLPGIIEKLPYLKKLGIDMIWINPFYPSPQKDNGYDISNYCEVDSLFGTMNDFDNLVLEAKKLEIDLMLDMVLNHVSTEHQWFQKAKNGNSYYKDFFYIREGKNKHLPPNNWQSKFGGSAWNKLNLEENKYYLCLYDKTQADLNWHNPNVREELKKVVRFWMNKGVKGFRFDVLNVIGKNQDFVDSVDSEQEKKLYTDTPIVHQWVQELHNDTFSKIEDSITVGEMSSTTVDQGILYTNPKRKEVDMIFSFHHLKVDYENGNKWSSVNYDLNVLKEILFEWQEGMEKGNGWNALFWNNHDQPRANQRFGDIVNFPFETNSLLATTIHLMRGTPFIYQGEEIGMTDPIYSSINEYQDIESHNAYNKLICEGLSDEQAFDIIKTKSRDNSRTPMQWTSGKFAGFSSETPWLKINENYTTINVQRELNNGKLFNYYQCLIKLRHNEKVISDGRFIPILKEDTEVIAYLRVYNDQAIIVFNHFKNSTYSITTKYLKMTGDVLIGNYKNVIRREDKLTLRPFESVGFWIKDVKQLLNALE
ncbi:alpha,alpha-phosphotrehalase [Atopobacter phocae]|uniref:alpha,alpha-phosphotrehalase n=1 Tax=Atopobacter phocae TaxID=136492 RepID=UPI00046F39EF|nr:alpha,alpha-phosphotrehalase [Atopobacter phocae]